MAKTQFARMSEPFRKKLNVKNKPNTQKKNLIFHRLDIEIFLLNQACWMVGWLDGGLYYDCMLMVSTLSNFNRFDPIKNKLVMILVYLILG